MYGNFSTAYATPQNSQCPATLSSSSPLYPLLLFPPLAQFNNIWTMNWQNIYTNTNFQRGVVENVKTQFPISHSHAHTLAHFEGKVQSDIASYAALRLALRGLFRELIETSFHQIIAPLSC